MDDVSPRAVVFDLWQTLVRWPEDESREVRRRWSESLGVAADRVDEFWNDEAFYRRRETGPIRAALLELRDAMGADAELDDVLAWRLEVTRRALVPDPGVPETLAALRRRGVGTAVISNCTEEVALVWDESPFAGLVDAVVFSATAGCMKPDPRIYELAYRALEIAPSDCLFVGDGANDELGGAQRVGMTPVLIHPPKEQPVWDGLVEWEGLRITSIPQVLDLVHGG
jgi:putative hydrolase of the HAD superfamily